ncbi:TetR/AcrR family transcriptional regulator [Sphingopyxis sp. J-6]|uniref:TetR/AcrR family transcriptional regulator n=1 Tax=Sphingopyxis sp. J-6 TaxID=3122054 RepID=UPI003983E968
MPKLNQQAMRQRREHIVDAAIRQFAKQGFGGSSVDAICAEAGISKGAFYTHFESKDAVMLELLARRGAIYDAIAASTLAEFEEMFFDLMLRGLSDVDSRLEVEAVTIGASNDAIKQALIANSERCERRLSEVIGELLADGKIEMVDAVTPVEAASMLYTYASGRLSLHVYETANKDREARRGLAITLAGLVRAPG